MHATFITYLKNHTSLADSAIQEIASTAEVRILKRNESILTAGQVCRHKAFIAKGLLRSYTTGTDGNEHILHFSPENTWTLDPESYDNQTPASINIAAIEPAEVLLWQKSTFEQLLAAHPDLQVFAGRLVQRTNYSIRQRIATTLSATPHERYDDFVANFPNLLQRLPLHMIASYLGISLKTLTRIRQAQLQR